MGKDGKQKYNYGMYNKLKIDKSFIWGIKNDWYDLDYFSKDAF